MVALLLCCVSCSKSLSDEEYVAAAQNSAGWFAQHYELVHDPMVLQYFDTLTARLDRAAAYRASASGPLEHYSGSPWTVLIAKSEVPNAYSLGARTIVLTSGLLLLVNDEAELAAILAHEMAHDILGHTREQYPEQDRRSRPTVAFEPKHELEADEMSIRIINHAAYDARAALTSLARMYRPHAGKVAGAATALGTERLGRSYQQVWRRTDPITPGIVESRSFRRMRARVSALL